jgi:hypothetical protein
MSDLKRKTLPMFSASPLAVANAQRLIDKAGDLKKAETSPLAEAVYEILFAMGFLIEQNDALRTEVKWNTESTINNELTTRQIKEEQKSVKAELGKIQGIESDRSSKFTILGWFLEKGWTILTILLAATSGALATWVINLSNKGTP